MPNEVRIAITAQDKASAALKNIGSQTEKLGSAFKGLALAAGGALAAFASIKTITSAIGATAELGAEVNKMRRETGLAAEDASRLLFAFKHVGLDGDTASKSIGIFAKGLKGIADTSEDAVESTKPMAGILKDIGITALDAAGDIRPVNELLPELADKFKDMPNGLEKTGLAMQLFGRSGKDMIPLLNLGSEGLADLAKQADKLGVTLTGKNADAIKKFTLAQRDMKEAIVGLKLQIGLALMPALTKLTEWFTANQPKIREFISEGIDKLKDALTTVGPIVQQWAEDWGHLAEALQTFGGWLIDHKEALVVALVAIGAAFVWANPVAGIAVGIVAIAGAVEILRTDVEKMPRPLLELRLGILEALEPMLQFLEVFTDFAGVLGLIPGPIGEMAKAANKIVNPLGAIGQELEEPVNSALGDLQQNLKDTRARLNELDVSDALKSFQDLGVWTDEATRSSGALISMTEMMNPALNGIDTSKTVGQLDNICTAAAGARGEINLLISSLANTAISRVKEFIGQFGPQQSLAPGYEMGGVVPGPLGRPQLALVHGGEEIIRAVDRPGGRQIVNSYNSTVEMHMTVNGTTEDGVKKFEDALNKALRRAGFGGSFITGGAYMPS